jgi:hypothetical protein
MLGVFMTSGVALGTSKRNKENFQEYFEIHIGLRIFPEFRHRV